ncbi:hypothetical protein AB7M16_002345 [Bradyrhizobium sp. USDA 372]
MWVVSTPSSLHLSRRERSDRIEDAIRVRGYGLTFRCGPSPGLLRTMLRIAARNPTSPRRGEVK